MSQQAKKEDMISKKRYKHAKTMCQDAQFPPESEGGWGWAVCMGAFVVNFLTVGQQNSAGVVYSVLVDEYRSNRGDTAWVTSLASSTMYLFAPVCTALSERYGSRLIVVVGAFISALGLLASSLASDLLPLYFTYGVIWGMGASFGLFPSLVILSRYFRKRLALVTGIALSGAAVGSLIYGPLIQTLADRYGIQGTFRVLAAFQVFMLLAGFLYRQPPSPWNTQTQLSKAYDWSVFRKPAYIVWVVALSIFMLVFLVPFVHTVRLAVDMGTNKTKASFLTAFLAIGTFVGSILFGKVADCRPRDRIQICQLGLVGISISSTLVTMATTYEHVVVYAFFFGLFDGCYEMIVPVITENIVGTRRVGYAIGGLYCILAFPKTMGPPIAGWIYEASSSYNVAFYITGAVTMASVLILFLIPNCTSFGNAQNTTSLALCSDAQPLTESCTTDYSGTSATPNYSTCEKSVGTELSDETLIFSKDSWLKKQALIAQNYEYLVVEKLTCV